MILCRLCMIVAYLIAAAGVAALVIAGIDPDEECEYPPDKFTIFLAAMLWPLTVTAAFIYAMVNGDI